MSCWKGSCQCTVFCIQRFPVVNSLLAEGLCFQGCGVRLDLQSSFILGDVVVALVELISFCVGDFVLYRTGFSNGSCCLNITDFPFYESILTCYFRTCKRRTVVLLAAAGGYQMNVFLCYSKCSGCNNRFELIGNILASLVSYCIRLNCVGCCSGVCYGSFCCYFNCVSIRCATSAPAVIGLPS